MNFKNLPIFNPTSNPKNSVTQSLCNGKIFTAKNFFLVKNGHVKIVKNIYMLTKSIIIASLKKSSKF